jgi:hypothetical protein
MYGWRFPLDTVQADDLLGFEDDGDHEHYWFEDDEDDDVRIYSPDEDDDFPMMLEYDGPFGLSGFDDY